MYVICIPWDPITMSEDDWGVQPPPKRNVFRFHYHFHVIGYIMIFCIYNICEIEVRQQQ